MRVSHGGVSDIRGASARPGRTIALCFLMAIVEGLDIQSMGAPPPGVAAEFGLKPVMVGLVLSASILGLAFGAALGGRASISGTRLRDYSGTFVPE